MQKKFEKDEKVMEEVTLENVEVLEETLTPGGLGFDCSYHGWIGFGC